MKMMKGDMISSLKLHLFLPQKVHKNIINFLTQIYAGLTTLTSCLIVSKYE